jgi:hypothetical protein
MVLGTLDHDHVPLGEYDVPVDERRVGRLDAPLNGVVVHGYRAEQGPQSSFRT